MKYRLFGAMMMVTGTSIGAGMLALPVSTSHNDLISSSLLMVACWLVMTLGALFLLEVNLALSPGNNLISMAKVSLGRTCSLITWCLNLLLLYALLSAYITAGGQITQHWLQALNWPLSFSLAALIFTVILGGIVLRGIFWVDLSNRGLMLIKLAVLLFLLLTIAPHIHWASASFGTTQGIWSATTIIITSFGFATIIPSLRYLFPDDPLALRKVIIIGSIIPLPLYIFWNIAVHSTLPISGTYSLHAMQQSGNASNQLAKALIWATQSAAIKIFANIFTSICVLTSFLGVALSLSDFLADGTGIAKNTVYGLSVNALLTFGLPILVTIFYPKIFMYALSYAGIICILLLACLPVIMAYALRKQNLTLAYRVAGGDYTLYLAGVLAIAALILGIYYF